MRLAEAGHQRLDAGQRRRRRRRHFRKPTIEPTLSGMAPSTPITTATTPVEPPRRRFAARRRELQRLVTRRAQERIDAGKQTFIELAGPEPRHHVSIENRPHLAIGQHALEPIADFDADAAIAGGPEQQQPVVLRLLPIFHSSKSLTAASSIDRPSRERMTTTAISAPFVRSNSPMVALSLAMVSARSVPGMSVTHVPSLVRGLGML